MLSCRNSTHAIRGRQSLWMHRPIGKRSTQRKPTGAVSWYRLHLETSLALIEQAATGCSAWVIDVGGGESTLVDDLLSRGYETITILDISQTAVDANRKRLGKASERVHMLLQALRLHLHEGAAQGVGWLFALADPHMLLQALSSSTIEQYCRLSTYPAQRP